MRHRFGSSARAARCLAAVVVCCALVSCNRVPDEPRPTGTLEPSITESSPIPAARKPSGACSLLKADERAALPGLSMNAVVPVSPAPGTLECLWVHSSTVPARAAIRIVALSAPVWARQAAPQLTSTINASTTSKPMAKRLKKALGELSRGPDQLPPERICEIFLLMAKAHGLRETDVIGYSYIGAMPAAYATMCHDGIMILAGYGEYGLRPSLALNHGVVRLAEAAHDRAVGLFGATATTKKGATTSASPGVETASPEPSSSPSNEYSYSSDSDRSSPSPAER